MKKKTEDLIQQRFLKLAEIMPIDEIDVNMICNGLKIKRQTFYYHYKNIYDVILYLYSHDSIFKDNIKKIEYSEIIEKTVGYLFLREDFNREVINSNSNDILKEFIYSNLYKAIILYLKKYKLNISQKREEAIFLAKSLSEYISYLFQNVRNDESEIIEKVLRFLNEDIVVNITRSYISSFKYNK